MRRLIESLVPEGDQICWKWIGGVFALYLVMLGVAVGAFVSHQSTRAHESVSSAAIDKKLRPVNEAFQLLRQAAGYD